jgi:hypothetical protein
MKALKPPKPINFELIPPMDGIHEPEPYKILREMRDKYHPDLNKARIALAWRKKLKRDQDGHLILGRCVKASDLQRELIDWDFVILLNREVWLDDAFTPEKKRALVDHELCHADAARDKDGFPKRDERDRSVWRTRKHDIEEFRCIVERHGCYKKDLEAFADALLRNRGNLVFPGMGTPASDAPPKTAAPPEASIEERARTRKSKNKITVIVKERPTDPPAPGAQP